MRRATIAAVLLLVVAGAFVGPVGVTSAQADSAPQDGPQQNGDDSGAGSDSVVAEVDSSVRVVDYSYDEGNETMSVTFENIGTSSTSVTMTEALGSDDGGAASFGIEQFRLRPNTETTVDISVRRVDRTASVMITTDESLRAGSGVRIQDVAPFEFGIFEGVPAWSTVWFGVGVALVGTGGLSLLAAWQYVATYHDDIQDVDIRGGGSQ